MPGSKSGHSEISQTTPDDVAAIRRLAETSAGVNRIAALFALGKAHDDLGDHAAAFEAWETANSELLTASGLTTRARLAG